MAKLSRAMTVAMLCSLTLWGCGSRSSDSANAATTSADTHAMAMSGHVHTFPPASAKPVDIVRDPGDLPPPVGDRSAEHVTFNLVAKEVLGRLAPYTTYTYWTFNGKVPGPMLRVRVGDTVTVRLKNLTSSHMKHSVDLHAVIGPGGGSAVMQVEPGHEKSFTFKAMRPGVFMYHCATPIVAEHIANGMFGLVVVVPAGGLPKVDHEYYVMQSEIYTTGRFGQTGRQHLDIKKLMNEQPEYYVFNGAVGALTKQYPLKAKVGQTVRLFFGDAGPNKSCSFHIIGEVMDKVYVWGSLSNPPLKDISVITVPAAGTILAAFTVHQPGTYLLVDHAMSRMMRGLMGDLVVTGKADAATYRAGE